MNFPYNTRKPPLVLPHYGRYINDLVLYVKEFSDKATRNELAALTVRIMAASKGLNPNIFTKSVWYDFMKICKWEIDIDLPPEAEQKPREDVEVNFSYYKKEKYAKPYGKIIYAVLHKAREIQDEEVLAIYLNDIANYMKISYMAWNKENVLDQHIIEDMLKIYDKPVPEHILESISLKKVNLNYSKTNSKYSSSRNLRSNKKKAPFKRK